MLWLLRTFFLTKMRICLSLRKLLLLHFQNEPERTRTDSYCKLCFLFCSLAETAPVEPCSWMNLLVPDTPFISDTLSPLAQKPGGSLLKAYFAPPGTTSPCLFILYIFNKVGHKTICLFPLQYQLQEFNNLIRSTNTF